MSVASRARAKSWVEQVNAKTPEWARKQIAKMDRTRLITEKTLELRAARGSTNYDALVASFLTLIRRKEVL